MIYLDEPIFLQVPQHTLVLFPAGSAVPLRARCVLRAHDDDLRELPCAFALGETEVPRWTLRISSIRPLQHDDAVDLEVSIEENGAFRFEARDARTRARCRVEVVEGKDALAPVATPTYR